MTEGIPYALVVLKDGEQQEYPESTVDVFDGRTLTVTHEPSGVALKTFKPGTWRVGAKYDAQHYQEFFFDTFDWRTTGQRKY